MLNIWEWASQPIHWPFLKSVLFLGLLDPLLGRQSTASPQKKDSFLPQPTETGLTQSFKDLRLKPMSVRFHHHLFKALEYLHDDEFWFIWYATLQNWQGSLENYGRVHFGEVPFSICKNYQVHSELKWKLIYGNQSSPHENTYLENTSFI